MSVADNTTLKTPSDVPASQGNLVVKPITRHHPAHGVEEQFSTPTIVYVTVCSKYRTKWMANEGVHQTLIDVWKQADAWLIGRYVIMPDHMHFFCSPNTDTIELDDWITYWKSQYSKARKRKDERWLTDHWDTRLRRHESYDEKWMYVENNPVRHGLVVNPKDWPYQGELNTLRWI